MLQIYTGAGKGKTTAAIGLAVRAVGAGLTVYIMQFMKSYAYSEQKVLANLSEKLALDTAGKPFFIAEEGMLTEEERKAWGDDVVIFSAGKPPVDYVKLMEAGFSRMKERSKCADVIILDEINVALSFGLLERKAVENFLEERAAKEIICTGRNAPEWLLARADLVTEMREVKHYYHRGIAARKGIEN